MNRYGKLSKISKMKTSVTKKVASVKVNTSFNTLIFFVPSHQCNLFKGGRNSDILILLPSPLIYLSSLTLKNNN